MKNSLTAQTALVKRLLLIASILMGHSSMPYAEIVIPSDAVYHYYDNEGYLHIGSVVPPEFIKNGYIVKDSYGVVLQKVDKALTQKQIDEMESKHEEEVRLELQKKSQAQKDKVLLRAFSSVENAQRALDRKLAAIDVIIDITKGNVLQLEMDYEKEQREAAKYERSGQEVPDTLFERLDSIKEQIHEAFRFIRTKQEEKKLVRLDYEEDINRLRKITSSSHQ